jgi:hypothetical protein
MKTETVTIVRIYVRERENLLEKLVTFLREETEVAGVTVLRGLEGFAEAREPGPAFLLDLSLDLPLVIEFFDEPARVEGILHSLARRFPLRHVVSWTATRHIAG